MTSDPTARLAEFLAIGDTSRNLPGVAIKDAAAMLVIDRTGPAAKVLLGRRHHGHKFMPGKYVFPGGRVEPADRRISADLDTGEGDIGCMQAVLGRVGLLSDALGI